MSRLRAKRRPRRILAGSALCAAAVLCALAVSSYLRRPVLSPMAQASLREPAAVAPQPQKEKYTITANDAGKTYSFALGSRFSVFLDEVHYPKAKLSCAPAGVVAPSSDVPVATKPLWVVRFDAVGEGSCRLSDADFSLTIIVDAGN